MSSPFVEARSVSKRFGGVHALVDVSLELEGGVIHALVGENGAGKTTLGGIIGGVVGPDRGVVLVDGTPVRFRAPRDAARAGIATIAQEVSLVPARTVVENVLLGVEPARAGFVCRNALKRRFDELTRSSGFDLDPAATVRSLPVAEQRKVEIVRALARGARLIVMDEPTASLGRAERERLSEIIVRLRAGGTTVLLVSHDLHEVLELAESVTVLRDGRVVKSGPTRSESAGSLIAAMLGREIATAFPPKRLQRPAAPVLETHGLTRRGAFTDVSLRVDRGEIVGLVGIAGSGCSEVLRAIFGAEPPDNGDMLLDREPVVVRHPKDAARHGIVLLPERRIEQGLVMRRPVRENVSLAALRTISTAGVVRRRDETSLVRGLAALLQIRAPSIEARASTLSGGNQQKVVLAKWLVRPPKVLLADQPTRGVDVGAKLQIHAVLADLAARGLAVLFIPSDIDEAVGVAHRLLVFRGGRIVDELDGATATGDVVMASMFGGPTEARAG